MIRRGTRWEDFPHSGSIPTPSSFSGMTAWRLHEYKAGRPSGLLDFYRAHGLCIACQASGKRPVPVEWDGDIPLFAACEVCGGSGKVQVS